MFFSILLLSRRSKFWYATKYMSWEYTVWILALSLYWSQSCARFSAFISAVFEEIFSIINNILCFFQFLLLSRRSKFGYATKYMSWEYTVWFLDLSLYWSQSCVRFSAFISAGFEETLMFFSFVSQFSLFFNQD